eukprot:TRINITY_DN7119_c0_g5_i4.p1 TRINITY_DN7119_c0_g5~~TRINITY_DN7119_c0_g5_i4.p1  ORF type:complete len:159 (-),score=32.82 TRINITY_DN7119_c0_g5_i4:389-865(-)
MIDFISESIISCILYLFPLLIMKRRLPSKKIKKDIQVRIKRRKAVLEVAKEEVKERSKSPATREREERDEALMKLIKETEDFDLSNKSISSFIHGPEHVQILSPYNNLCQGIPIDECRPCSFSVRQERYQRILYGYSNRGKIEEQQAVNYRQLRDLMS